MGISSSSRRRRHNNYYHQNPPSQLLSSYSTPPNPPYPYSAPPPPPAPNHGPYNHRQISYNYGWMPPPPPPPAALPPPSYVEHLQAKKVRNDVNVHKDTLRVEVDEENPDFHLVSFVFDALFDGSITILYFGKEEPNCKFVPVYAEAFEPVKVPFQKGVGQRFQQPSGTGIDLGFFDVDDLSKPSPGEDVFPLVVSAETTVPDEHLHDRLTGTRMQITQAILEKNTRGSFDVRVMKQILWIDGVRYELHEIYGIGSSAETFNDGDSGKDCVICLTEPKDTTVLPCRHMCLCSDCAKELRIQTNKCPICRQPIEELMEIKVNVGR